MADRKRIAQLLRMMSSSAGERRNAFAALERAMSSSGMSWTDIGNAVERGDDRYSEEEMQEYAQVARSEGVEAGIKIGLARADNGNGGANGGLTLPRPAEMAQFCHDRPGLLKDDRQRGFVSDMWVITRQRNHLSPKRLAYLATIYIQIGGKV